MKKENLLMLLLMWCLFIMLTMVTSITNERQERVFTINLEKEEEEKKVDLPDLEEVGKQRLIDHGLVVTETEPVEEVVPEVIEEPVEVVEEEVIVPEDIPYQWQSIDTNFNVFQPSHLNREELIYALGDIRSGLHDIVDAVIIAEETYGVNSLYLISVLGYESGWGKYENGWNNIAGWKGNYGNFSDFNSRYECVMTVAEGLVSRFQPAVGNRLGDVALRYCPDYGYTNTLLQIMGELDYSL